MKIGLFMIPPLTQGGGAEKYFINLARKLHSKKNRADIITMDDKFFSKFARLIHITYHRNFHKPINLQGRESYQHTITKLGQSKWIRASYITLKKTLNQYHILYVKNEIPELLLLKKLGYQNLPPIIIGVHTPIQYVIAKSFYSKMHNFLYDSYFYKFLLQEAKSIHASNEFTHNFIINKLHLPSDLIYYPFSTTESKITTKNIPKKITFDPQKKHVIFYGRLSEQKGPDIIEKLIQIISQSTLNTQKLMLHLFGSGEKSIEDKFSFLDQNYPWVHFYHHIENKYIPAILSKCQFVLSPSKWEVLPFNILEAQAAGLPVIAFNIPGPQDIIIHKKTGLLAQNENEFYQYFIDMFNNRYKFNKREIENNINQKFKPSTVYRQLLRMFQTRIHRQ